MTAISRRRFVQASGAGAVGLWIAARGAEAAAIAAQASPVGRDIILDSNENPAGPFAPVLAGVHDAFDAANRYPFATVTEIVSLLASRHRVRPENLLLGTGSTQILRTAVQLFTRGDRALVQGLPTFETPRSYAALIGSPVKSVPVTNAMAFDLDAMADAARGAGLVYLCNPNNPIPTAIDASSVRAFIDRVHRASPDTTILVDEAYFEYSALPGYETMIPLAAGNPRVIVARTFSKAYGMAGLRLGYAVGHADTIKAMSSWDGSGTVNVLALAAARAALTMDPSILTHEVARNAEVRTFTLKWFADRGYTPTASHANFVFVDLHRPAAAFREACRTRGVRVARDFPPFANSHCRITIGTMDEMQAAVRVFERVLAGVA